jgi:hypothetical protein
VRLVWPITKRFRGGTAQRSHELEERKPADMVELKTSKANKPSRSRHRKPGPKRKFSKGGWTRCNAIQYPMDPSRTIFVMTSVTYVFLFMRVWVLSVKQTQEVLDSLSSQIGKHLVDLNVQGINRSSCSQMPFTTMSKVRKVREPL